MASGPGPMGTGAYCVGQWKWSAQSNDWYWEGNCAPNWIGNPYNGYQQVPKPATSPTGAPLASGWTPTKHQQRPHQYGGSSGPGSGGTGSGAAPTNPYSNPYGGSGGMTASPPLPPAPVIQPPGQGQGSPPSTPAPGGQGGGQQSGSYQGTGQGTYLSFGPGSPYRTGEQQSDHTPRLTNEPEEQPVWTPPKAITDPAGAKNTAADFKPPIAWYDSAQAEEESSNSAADNTGAIERAFAVEVARLDGPIGSPQLLDVDGEDNAQSKILLGPWVILVSWIPDDLPEVIKDPLASGDDRFTAFGRGVVDRWKTYGSGHISNYAAVAAANVKALETSGNPDLDPLASLSDVQFKELLDSKEYRNVLRVRVGVECDRDQRVKRHWHVYDNYPGYTKIPVEDFVPEFAEGVLENRYLPGEVDPGSKFERTSREGVCAVYSVWARFRLGDLLNYAQSFGTGQEAPWAWSMIRYTMCCDGRFMVAFDGSYVPSHAAYVEKNGQFVPVGRSLMSEDTWKHGARLADFIHRGKGNDAEGTNFFIYRKK